MKTFIADIIPKFQRYSEKMDNATLLMSKHWVLIDNIEEEKQVYIFRPDNQLLISKNGKIEKGKWEYLGNKSLIIDQGDQAYLFKHGFFDENLLALKIDSKEEYALFVNENKYEGDINSSSKVVGFLTKHYLNTESQNVLENETGVKIEIKEKELTPEGKLKQQEDQIKESQKNIIAVRNFLILIVIIIALLYLVYL
jgi:hypothetical protein